MVSFLNEESSKASSLQTLFDEGAVTFEWKNKKTEKTTKKKKEIKI